MHALTIYGPLVARILLGMLFLIAGLGKIGSIEGFAGYMASGGVPEFLAWPVVAFEIVGGLALILGFQTRIAALALGAFCVVAGFLYDFNPADQQAMISFYKNMALGGGYLALAILGTGSFALDKRFGPRTVAA
jgi:putative oxidoreductase